MTWSRDRYGELRRLVRGRRIAEEVDEEVAHHLAMRYADNLAGGMSEEEAWRDAQRRFGNVARVKVETMRIDEEAEREERRVEIIDSIIRETKLALRSILRAPSFAILAIVTLGLGLGSASAIYTLLDSVVIRPLPYARADRLVQLWHPVPKVGSAQRWGTSEAGYFAYLDDNRSFEKLGGFQETSFSLNQRGSTDRVSGMGVTSSMFDVLGTRAAVGRLFGAEDDRPGRPSAVVLSYDEWKSRYGSRRDAVGSTINLNGQQRTIIGVLPPRFHLPGKSAAYYVDLQLDRAKAPMNYHWVGVYGILRTGVTPGAASADLARVMNTFPERMPGAYSTDFFSGTGFHPEVTMVRSELLGGIEKTLWILLAAVLLVLIIACVNVANLFLVRTEARRREIAVRTALGAESPHLAVHFLAESMVIALMSAALASGICYGAIRLLVAIAPAEIPRLDEIGMTWRTLTFGVVVSILAGLVFGSFPLFRRGSFGALREGGRGMTASRTQHLVRHSLVAAQMALALVLLVGGALLLQSYRNLRNVDLGINADGVLTAEIALPGSRYGTHESARDAYEQIAARIKAVPGVVSVGTTATLPLAGKSYCSVTEIEAAPGKPRDAACATIAHVSPGYFDALGVKVRGEQFTWSDLDHRNGVAIISRALANRFFPGADPIGKNIISFRSGPPWYRIVGVAEDVHADGADRPVIQPIYYPITPMDIPGVWDIQTEQTLVIRTRLANPEQLVPAVRSIVTQFDPQIAIANARSMNAVISASPAVARSSFTLLLLLVSAAIALFLSIVGMYGVISYVTSQRRSEIGVRLAIGARADQVRRLIVTQSLTVVGAGVLAGLPIALGGTRLLRSLLFGVSPSDVTTYVGVTCILLLAGACASWVPALRAGNVEPMNVLRED